MARGGDGDDEGPVVIPSVTGRRLKGVVFDVDGTLLTNGHQVSLRMQAVCRDLVEKGVWLTIASARPPTSVQQIAKFIGAHGPLCALNGAIILTQDGTIERRLSMPPDIANALIARRSEEHTSELQSRFDLVCRLLL